MDHRFPPPPFELWCGVVSYHLEQLAGRPLADLPDLDNRLRVWWWRGVPARVVASALTTLCPPVRATLSRWYLDQRPHEVLVQLQGSFVAQGGIAAK